MIKDNTIYFGRGDIAVGNVVYYLTIQNIKTHKICGELIEKKSAEYSGESIEIMLTLDECNELLVLLKDVYMRNIDSFMYKNIVFDFSTYNADSVRVLNNYINAIKWYYYSLMAC